MRQLPEDPADWSEEDLAFARNWDVNFAPQLAAYAALDREPTPTPTPSEELADAAAIPPVEPVERSEDPALVLPWLAPTPSVVEQGQDGSSDDYDHWKRDELKAEAARRDLSLAEGVDSRAKQSWIDVLRADDAARMSGS